MAVVDSYLSNLLANGEVVLIETRQHWMAALRYALRPILILLAAIGVALLGAWLDFDGWLSGLNDLLYWLMLVLLVISVIWLPIDLVRWYSRRYVLTNRRVMRMDGVLRKGSFDSSLEQINDIRTEQSLLGRTLGYADLTIYTASDTANEVYSQLLDGLQFKKAVMESKEALRSGQPLIALPAGFVVKGGTNESSRRAAGKAAEDAADAEAAAAGGTGGFAAGGTGAATSSAAAAGVVAAATVIEPSGEVPGAAAMAPVLEPVAEVVPPVTAPEPVVVPPPIAPEPEPVVEPEPAPEPVVVPPSVMPEPEPVVEPEPAPEPVFVPPSVMPEPEPVVEPEPGIEPLVVPEPEPAVEPETMVRPEAASADEAFESTPDAIDSAPDDAPRP